MKNHQGESGHCKFIHPLVISCCVLVLSSGYAVGQESNQYKSVKHRVVQSSPKEAGTAAEVSVAINPVNKDEIIAGAIMRGVPKQNAPNYSMHSTDGGKSWKTVPVPNSDRRSQGDDVVIFDHKGNAIHGYISFAGLWNRSSSKQASGIHITRKKAGQSEWSPAVVVVDHLNTVSPMEDKPWFVFDRNPKSRYAGNLYCSWTQFDNYGSKSPTDRTRIVFSRSTNGGKSFQALVRVSDKDGNCIDDDDTVEGATPSVDSKGNIYIVWAGPRGLEMDISKDGGKTFGKDITVIDMPGGWSSSVKGVSRHNGMPVTGIDHSNGKFKDRLYINWIDERNGDKDVFLIYSDDQGKTWSKPKRVNNDKLKNGKDQFFTWMSVDPVDGSVNIAFYDRRNTDGTDTQLTLARSVDGGKTFRNFHISNQPNFKCYPGFFFGDYIGIDAVDGRVVVGYMNFLKKEGVRRPKLRISTAIFDFELGKQSAK